MGKYVSLLSLSLILAVGCSQQRGNEPDKSADNSSSSTSATSASTDANSNAGGQMSSSDQQFVTEAANGGMKEVELSNYVAQKTQSMEVRQLAERIAQDHSTANSELKSAAQQDNGNIPASMDEKAMQELDHFKKMSGTKLDQMYVQHMIEDHKKDIAKFQEEASGGTSRQVKAFAQKTLPTLQEHLQMAKDTQSKMGGGNSKAATSSGGDNQRQ
jgi:putative membrane protein